MLHRSLLDLRKRRPFQGERFIRRHLRGLHPASESTRPAIHSSPNRTLNCFEQMSQASPDALCIADSDHRVLWANETFVRMFGYAKRRNCRTAAGKSDRASGPCGGIAMGFGESLTKGERITLETKRRKKKDGTLVEVAVSCAPLARWRKRGRILRRIPRHFRSQARRGAQFGALPRRRKEQQRSRPAAVLRRRSRHRRRVDVRAQLLHRALRSRHRLAHLPLLCRRAGCPRLRRRNWDAASPTI